MSLQDPSKKMSKSDENPNNYISLLDEPDEIVRKLKRAVTDSNIDIVYDENRPGVANLLTLFSTLSKKSMKETEDHFSGKGYASLKSEVVEITIEVLKPIQQRYHELMSEKTELKSILQRGAEEANRRATKTLSKVYRKIGFLGRFS